MWKCRLHVSHACRNAESLRNICDIAWYMQLYLIHIWLYDIFVYCVYCEFIVIHLIFTHMCATQFHQCLALSVAFSWLWPVTYAKGHQQQHFLNNKNCADAHVRWESQTWLWNSLAFLGIPCGLHAKVFHLPGSGFGVRFPALKFGSGSDTLRLRQPPWPPADARLDRPSFFFGVTVNVYGIYHHMYIYIYIFVFWMISL